MFWMITNRNVQSNGFGDDFGTLTFWANPKGRLDQFSEWTQIKSADDFRNALIGDGNQGVAEIVSALDLRPFTELVESALGIGPEGERAEIVAEAIRLNVAIGDHPEHGCEPLSWVWNIVPA